MPPQGTGPARTPLTGSQCQLLQGLAQGLDTQTAADKLEIYPNTAYVRLNNCRERLGVGATLQAVKKAQELGLLGGTVQ
jgi:DNA-binding NarL/FixJ family response regulator